MNQNLLKPPVNCLFDYIGLNWCNAPVPESGLYVNSLPGISLKAVDSIADEEQMTFAGVWNQVQLRAIAVLNNALVNEFGKRYKLCRLSETFDLGQNVDLNNSETLDINVARGLMITLSPGASGLQYIYIQELWLYSLAQTTCHLSFFDLTRNQEIAGLDIDLVQGWNRLPLNREFFNVSKLAVIYRGATETPLLLLDPLQAADCCTTCWKQSGCDATVQGVKTDNNNPVFGNNTYGLSAVFSVRCGYDTLICGNRNLFATALWYLLGAEILTERLHSDRLNRYTTIDLKKAQELREKFYEKYKQELAAAVGGVQLNPADCCLECNQSLTLQTSLP